MSTSKLACLVFGLLLVMAGGMYAQTSTTVEKAEIEIVYVSGNTVTFLLNGEVKKYEAKPDFRVMVDGKPTPVSALVPGQKVMVERMTTTTVVPGTQTVKVRDGEFISATKTSLMYRENNEIKTVNVPADFKFVVDGKPVDFYKLRKGDKLTATIITTGPATSTTTKEVSASAQAPEAPAPPPAPTAAPAPPAPAPAPAPVHKLPKTASQLPLLGLAGSLLLALGAGLWLSRRLF
jgi:LPXTG-motif cell wall-anchored protein